MVKISANHRCHRFLLKFYDKTHRKYDMYSELLIQQNKSTCFDCTFYKSISTFVYGIQLDRTTLSEQEEENIQQLVYDHLKKLNTNQSQIKCNVGDGPVGDLVEEITISRPILVRSGALLLDIKRLLSCFRSNLAKLALISHYFSCTMPSSKTSTFSFTR